MKLNETSAPPFFPPPHSPYAAVLMVRKRWKPDHNQQDPTLVQQSNLLKGGKASSFRFDQVDESDFPATCNMTGI